MALHGEEDDGRQLLTSIVTIIDALFKGAQF